MKTWLLNLLKTWVTDLLLTVKGESGLTYRLKWLAVTIIASAVLVLTATTGTLQKLNPWNLLNIEDAEASYRYPSSTRSFTQEIRNELPSCNVRHVSTLRPGPRRSHRCETSR